MSEIILAAQMSWGDYCNIAGVVVGVITLVGGVWLSILYDKVGYETSALPVVALLVGIAVASLAQFDPNFVAQQKATEATAAHNREIAQTARQLFDDYLKEHKYDELVAYVRYGTVPERFVEKAHEDARVGTK